MRCVYDVNNDAPRNARLGRRQRGSRGTNNNGQGSGGAGAMATTSMSR